MCPRFDGEPGCWMIFVQSPVEASCHAPPLSAGVRRKVLDLVAAGRPVAQVAAALQISDHVIDLWGRQHLIDTGQLPGITSSDHAEPVAARKRIAELEAELAIHRRSAE